MLFHPLAAPDAGIEERGDAERTGGGLLEGGAQRFAADQRRRLFLRGIDQIVGAFEQRRFVAIEDSPFDKKGALIATEDVLVLVVRPPVPEAVMAHALLNFPARHIGIDQHIARMNERGAGTINNDEAFGHGIDLLAQLM